jgi:hypothetical protein
MVSQSGGFKKQLKLTDIKPDALTGGAIIQFDILILYNQRAFAAHRTYHRNFSSNSIIRVLNAGYNAFKKILSPLCR